MRPGLPKKARPCGNSGFALSRILAGRSRAIFEGVGILTGHRKVAPNLENSKLKKVLFSGREKSLRFFHKGIIYLIQF